MNTKDATYGGRAPDPSGSKTFIEELFTAGIYKRTQGKMVRQLTCLAIWVFVAAAVWRCHSLYLYPMISNKAVGYLVAVAIAAVGGWIGFRLVNWAKFADFLISVEAELNKVSWPTRKELIRASMVVIFTILFMSALLFLYDAFWRVLFVTLGIA